MMLNFRVKIKKCLTELIPSHTLCKWLNKSERDQLAAQQNLPRESFLGILRIQLLFIQLLLLLQLLHCICNTANVKHDLLQNLCDIDCIISELENVTDMTDISV